MKPPGFLDNKWLQLFLRLALGGVFIYAAASKIYAPDKFAIAISNYRLLPHEWINLAALTVPWVEIVTGSLLILGVWPRANALILLGLTVAFLFMISSALARGLNIECGCFGTVGGRKVGLTSLAFDALLLVMAAVLVWRLKDRPEELPPPAPDRSTAPA
jgi:uncharacterized membrane protein YphA (DoxX/SURF4 family)